MDQILAQVARAHRRLWLELFLNRWFTCLFGALIFAVVAMAVPKIVAIPNLPANWTWWCAFGAAGLGTVAALAWTSLRGLSPLDAAVELDRRFELRERVSSSLTLSPEAVATPAGQALLHDAARAVERVEVGTRFGITLPQRRWLPVVTTVFAFLLLSLFENQTAQSGMEARAAAQAKEQRENVAQQLKKRLVERKKKAAEKGLKETTGLFEQLEKETEKLRKNAAADQKKSLVKLNDLAQKLEKRRREVGSKEEMRKQLGHLDKLNKGPAEKMAEAMKNGNWQKAAEELESLNEQFKKGDLSEEAQKSLQEQFKTLQEKLAETTQAHEQSLENLKKQIQQQQEQGQLTEAGELQQKLEKQQAQEGPLDKLNQLGAKMGQAQKALKEGDASKASKAMNEMSKDMQSLDAQMQEGEMLEAAMAEMQMAKDAMACQDCAGEGCQSCQGKPGNLSSQPSNKPGRGMGKGTREGQGENTEIDAKFNDSHVPQQTGRGATIYAGEAEGPNIRGQISSAVQAEMATSGGTPADPQVLDELPKSRREHAEEYFNLLREGP